MGRRDKPGGDEYLLEHFQMKWTPVRRQKML
jgi:hypothetical protein